MGDADYGVTPGPTPGSVTIVIVGSGPPPTPETVLITKQPLTYADHVEAEYTAGYWHWYYYFDFLSHGVRAHWGNDYECDESLVWPGDVVDEGTLTRVPTPSP
jgi:hypothetical protein